MQRDTMASVIAKDLVAASATPLVLSILNHGDSYGYEIIQQVKERSNGLLEWADGMLYPILHRMEKNTLIESYWGKAETGRKRKYYTLLDNGRNELAQQQDQWHQLYTLLMSFKGE
jgi:DNA-binding PadR family transcriptional regulator